MSLKLRQVLPLAALVVVAVASGCSSSTSDPPQTDTPDFDTPKAVSLRPESVKANQHFANSVSVEDTRLVVTMDADNETMLSTVKVGTIIAGNRDTATADLTLSKNPYGFLRRVTDMSRSGNQAILTTERANLEDWMEEGDIAMGDGERSIFEDATAPTTQSADGVHILGGSAGAAQPGSTQEASLEGNEASDPTKSVKVRPFAKVTNTKWALNAKYTGEFKLRKSWFVPTGVKRAKALLTMDPAVSADIEVGVRVTGGGTAIGGPNGYPIASMDKTFTGKSVVIPIDAGIPVTLRFEPQLKCSVSLQGSASVKFRAQLQVHAAAGFLYDGSFHDLSQAPTINPSFLHPVSAKVELDGTAECDLLMVPAVLAFDAVGLEGKVGPYVSLNANACVLYDAVTAKTTFGFDAYEQHGLYGEFAGRVQVPVLGVGKDFSLITWHGLKSKPAYFVGDANTCNVQSKDSCQGKADGFYCSQLESYSGYYCQGGSITAGRQCADLSKKCKSGDATSITCQ
jgi:hypothetical protein